MKNFNEWVEQKESAEVNETELLIEESTPNLIYMLINNVDALLKKYPNDQDVIYLSKIAFSLNRNIRHAAHFQPQNGMMPSGAK